MVSSSKKSVLLIGGTSLVVSLYLHVTAFSVMSILVLLLTLAFFLLLVKGGILPLALAIPITFKVSGIEKLLVRETGISNIDIFLIFLVIFAYVLSKKKFILNRGELVCIILVTLFYLIYLCLGGIHSDSLLIFEFMKKAISNIVLLILAIQLLKLIGFNGYLKTLVTIGTIVSLLGIYDWLYASLEQEVGSTYFYRSSGLFGNANLQAQTITVLIIPLIYLLLKKNINWILGYFIAGINIFSLLITQSRSSLIILILMLTLYIFSLRKGSQFGKVTIIFIVSSVMFAIYKLVTWLNPLFIERIIDGNENMGGFTNGRLDAVRYGINAIFSSMFGKGIGNSADNFLNLSSHNFYIHVLSEAGILFLPILMALVGFLLWILVKSVLLNLFKKGSLEMLSGFFVISFLSYGFFFHNLLLFGHWYLVLPIVIYEMGKLKKLEKQKKVFGMNGVKV